MSALMASLAELASPLVALRTVELLCAASVALQTAENLVNLPALSETGTWRWSLVRRDLAQLPPPLLAVFDALMSPRSLALLSIMQLSCALAMFVDPRACWAMACFVTSLIFAIRLRGSVNGGSDSITLITLACVTLGRGLDHDGRVVVGALIYIALQSIASYVIAGVVKLRSSRWRAGEALRRFADGAAVGPPPGALRPLLRGPFARAASFCVIAFELSAPVALASPRFALMFVSGGLFFHALNAYILGLHRFFWAWLATYPAILFTATLLL